MPKQPNILVLLADQLRYDALSCNGAPVCRTPAMDAVAAAGVRFSSAFTPIAARLQPVHLVVLPLTLTRTYGVYTVTA